MSLASAAVAAHRFGLGARPGELTRIAADPRGWLEAQLVPEVEPPAPIAALPPTGDDLALLPLALLERGLSRRLRGRAGQTMADGDAVAALREALAPRIVTGAAARLEAAVTTAAPFRERLIHFWSNHFIVSGVKGLTAALPPSFERDVIRRNVVGNFGTMLRASTQHPAMLLYLDNYLSIGPNSRYGRDPDPRRSLPFGARPEGLNENLAREILELHTVGVDAGYAQQDVVAFANVLTGWGVAPPFERSEIRRRLIATARGRGGPDVSALIETLRARAAEVPGEDWFRFDADAHEPGAFTVLGRRYADGGVEQGEAVLADLARHPATAHHVATELVRHFVADTPPPAAVARVARAFRDSEGDLAVVGRALIACPEAWSVAPAKFKRPDEYLISVARGLGMTEVPGRPFTLALTEMGQPPYRPPGPDGWPELESHWASPDGLWKRLEWVDTLAARVATAGFEVGARAEDVLGPRLGPATRASVARAASPSEALALWLLSPEFMRR